MAVLTDRQGPEGFVISQGPHTRSKENITVLGGTGGNDRTLLAGTVLGARLSGTAAATAGAGNVGNGAMGAITVSGPAKQGRYVLTIVEPGANAGAFILEDPDGETVGEGAVAAAFSGSGLAFTLADGATDFAAGDQIFIDVNPSALKYLALDTDATTGEQEAVGILRADVVAPSTVDVDAVALVRDCEVNGNRLVWPDGITADELELHTFQLAQRGIIIRT